ncbi:MAG: cytochrome c biogenesis protein ResB [Fibrobacterota bacterium]
MFVKDIIVLRKLLSIAASPRLTASCLIVMICMVISGTVYEASHGLLEARERFFESWFSLAFGVFPFPGIKLIALILLMNLLFRSVQFLSNPIKNSGLIIIHCGVAMLLAGALLSSKMAHEYILPLSIGETSDTVMNLSEEELVIHSEDGQDTRGTLTDTVIPVKKLRKGESITIGDKTITIDAINKHKNRIHNGEDKRQSIEIVVSYDALCQSSTGNQLVVKSTTPAQKLLCSNITIIMEIRPVTKKLPVNITLKDFTKQLHQGTQTLKYVQSQVVIRGELFVRDAIITMNKPLRYRNYTFYQSSYSEQQGRTFSVFSVVHNPYKITPYIASLTIIGGGLLHMLLMIIAGKRKRDINSDAR